MKFKQLITYTSRITVSVFMLLVTGLISCKKPGITYEDFEAANIAVLNVWNNEDAPQLTFSLDTSKALHGGNVSYGRQLGYYVIYAGNRTMKIKGVNDGSSILEKPLNLESKKIYSMFLTGTKKSPEVVMVEDNVAVESPVGKYRIRVANMVTDPGSQYALYAAEVGQTLDNAQVLVNPTPVKTVSDFAEFASNANPQQRFRLWMIDSGRDTLLFDNILLSSQKAYTYTIGGSKNEGLKKTSVHSFVNGLTY